MDKQGHYCPPNSIGRGQKKEWNMLLWKMKLYYNMDINKFSLKLGPHTNHIIKSCTWHTEIYVSIYSVIQYCLMKNEFICGYTCIHFYLVILAAGFLLQVSNNCRAMTLNSTRTIRTPAFWGYPPPPHDYPHYWVMLDPKSKQGRMTLKI